MRRALSALALGAIATLAAQDIDLTKQRLALPSEKFTAIYVEESDSARVAVERYRELLPSSHLKGYRINIFFSNSPTARADAQKIKERFEELFPEIEVFMSYQNPYFKVEVGSCVEQDEASMLLAKVQRKFPKAYLTREQMSAASLRIAEPEMEIDSLLIDSLFLDSLMRLQISADSLLIAR
ncbi:MAG: hypothetical protein SNH88_05110 [Rikenellaceae bacterium]